MSDAALRELYALAWLDALQRRAPLRPAGAPAAPIRLDDTGRAPYVPLRGSRG